MTPIAFPIAFTNASSKPTSGSTMYLRIFTLFIVVLVMAASRVNAQTFTVLHAFTNSIGGGSAEPSGNVTFDGNGNMYGTTVYGGTSDCGTIWKYSASGQYSVLHNFTGGANGGNPYGSVTFDSSGNMYGTTEYGGNSDWGTIWEFSSTGNFSVLHRFTYDIDGAYPLAGVTFDKSGNMYGTAGGGSPLEFGTIWEYSAGGTFSVLHTFVGGSDNGDPLGSVTFDKSGNMFGTTNGVGSGAGTVWEISAAGQYSAIYSFSGGIDGGFPSANVTFDKNGNMYGTTLYGGAPGDANGSGYGTVWEYSTSGTFSVLHAFNGGSDSCYPYGGVAIASNGNLYGTATNIWESGNGTLWEYNPSGNFYVLHTFTGGNDGGAPTGSITFDSKGNIYGTATEGGSSANGTLWKYVPYNGQVHYITASPSSVTGGNSSTGTVYLTTAAPTAGVTVSLASSSKDAQVPSNVTIPAGSTSASFPVTTSGVIATEFINLSASYTTATVSCGFGIGSSIAIHYITAAPSSVIGGASSTGTVYLTNPAPSGGASVALSSSNPVAQVPVSVTVPAGQISATFNIKTLGSSSTVSLNLSATLNGKTVSSGFIVGASVAVHFVTITPSSVTGGTSSTGTVTLTGASPPGGTVLTLSSTNAAAQVPATVAVPAGQMSANFNITTSAVAVNTSLSISASLNGHSAGYGFVVAAPNFSGLSTKGSTTIFGGTNAAIIATLNGPAPAGGIVITLSSNSPDASVPATVTIPAGQTSATFTMTTSAVALPEMVTITGSHTQTQTITFKLKPIA